MYYCYYYLLYYLTLPILEEKWNIIEDIMNKQQTKEEFAAQTDDVH